MLFVAFGVSHGSPANFPPLFTHAPLVSILLVIQIVPYFMTGFESVGKAAEEASPEFSSRGFIARHLDGDRDRHAFLRDDRRRSRIRRAMASADR